MLIIMISWEDVKKSEGISVSIKDNITDAFNKIMGKIVCCLYSDSCVLGL